MSWPAAALSGPYGPHAGQSAWVVLCLGLRGLERPKELGSAAGGPIRSWPTRRGLERGLRTGAAAPAGSLGHRCMMHVPRFRPWKPPGAAVSGDPCLGDLLRCNTATVPLRHEATLPLRHLVTVWRCRGDTPRHSGCVALKLRRAVAQWRCRTETPSQRGSATMWRPVP
jgi:hypothetical protein